MKATVHNPRYVLRLDDLPKVAEADGVVWPVYLPMREAARLFHLRVEQMRDWVVRYNLPAIRVGDRAPRYYISVADLNDWIIAHSVSRADYVARFAKPADEDEETAE